MIRFVCECGRQLQARDEDVGKKARCPSCSVITTVPPESSAPSRSRPEVVAEDPPRRRQAADLDDQDDEPDDRPRRRRKAPGDESSGKATASLVLGLFSLCLPVLPAIPGLILGILALRDIGRSGDRLGGRGQALGGIIASCLSFVILLPAMVLAALLLPAWSRVSTARARVEDAGNLKLLTIGLINFADVHGRMPRPAAFVTREGRPGLSWRVAILPFLDQRNLYNQFKLDEAWDSPHNSRLIGRMPKVFLMPGQEDDGGGRTYYQAFVGRGTMFEPDQDKPPVPVKLPRPGEMPGQVRLGVRWPADITDGTSNTILIATARSSVVWTMPEDMKFVRHGPLPPVGGHFPRGFNVALADGSVRTLPQDVPEQTLKAMITRNGGEIAPVPGLQ